MMKRLIPCLLMLPLCVFTCFGNLAEYEETIDGYLTSGEYADSVLLEYEEQLIVNGGAADLIEAKQASYLEVRSTAPTLGYHSGIYDIVLFDQSELLYLGGVTEEITVRDDTKAFLKGGRIDGITVLSFPGDKGGVTVYCQEGYQWKYVSGQKKGITGLWQDGSSFDINFVNVGGIFPPTANFINVVEVIPEPTTLALLGLGGLLVRRKRS
jgi:hypothetical protein